MLVFAVVGTVVATSVQMVREAAKAVPEVAWRGARGPLSARVRRLVVRFEDIDLAALERASEDAKKRIEVMPEVISFESSGRTELPTVHFVPRAPHAHGALRPEHAAEAEPSVRALELEWKVNDASGLLERVTKALAGRGVASLK